MRLFLGILGILLGLTLAFSACKKTKIEDELQNSILLYRIDENISGGVLSIYRHPHQGLLLSNNKPGQALDENGNSLYIIEDETQKRYTFSSIDVFPALTKITSLKEKIVIFENGVEIFTEN